MLSHVVSGTMMPIDEQTNVDGILAIDGVMDTVATILMCSFLVQCPFVMILCCTGLSYLGWLLPFSFVTVIRHRYCTDLAL